MDFVGSVDDVSCILAPGDYLGLRVVSTCPVSCALTYDPLDWNMALDTACWARTLLGISLCSHIDGPIQTEDVPNKR